MTKGNAKDFLPLVQALAEGKTIQYFDEYKWKNCDDIYFSDANVKNYRIQPEKEYVPFDSVEELIECWNKKKYNGRPPYNAELEMPLIWVKHRTVNIKYLIIGFCDDSVSMSSLLVKLKDLFENYTFLDGSPIGKIKG